MIYHEKELNYCYSNKGNWGYASVCGYLMDMIRKYNFDTVIKKAMDNGIIYIGSSAGSEILGNSVEYALPFDENNVDLKDFSGLRIVDGIIIPHANRKEEFISKVKENIGEKLFLLYDENGIII